MPSLYDLPKVFVVVAKNFPFNPTKLFTAGGGKKVLEGQNNLSSNGKMYDITRKS